MSEETIKEQEAVEEVVVSAETETTEETAEPTIEEQLAAAEAQARENLEGWQRARAEFANAKKRFETQRIQARTNALVELSESLLPIIDDFDLAFADVPDSISETEWYGGLQLIPRKFTGILEKIGIERIPAMGEEFDPMVHNAIMREASDSAETGTIIKEFQAGYKIGDRILRHAVVVVAA